MSPEILTSPIVNVELSYVSISSTMSPPVRESVIVIFPSLMAIPLEKTYPLISIVKSASELSTLSLPSFISFTAVTTDPDIFSA